MIIPQMPRKAILILAITGAFVSAQAKPVNLKCEYLVNPIGIDAPHPRFTWQLEGKAASLAYQIIVGTDSVAVSKGSGNYWQGRSNAKYNLLTYASKPLRPFTKYFWAVRGLGKPAESSTVATFETGLMHMSNWQSTWISDANSINTKPAAYFRKTFNTGRKVISARAYIAAAGLYELYINGKRVGDHRLDPMYTRFDRRTLYVSYDVTAAMQNDANAIGVWLGNGWYNFQSMGVWDFERAPWRNRPAFCMDLRLTYSDGSIETVKTDESWKSSLSPISRNSIYTGEDYDARLEQPGWNNTGFNDRRWKSVQNRPAPSQNIVSQAMQPIRNVRKIACVNMTRLNDTTCIFDFGENFSGVAQITLDGAAGTVVRLIHGEKLYPSGMPDQSNVDYFLSEPTRANDPFATDVYTLNGKGEETFMPHFNYKGFRYVAVMSNKPLKLTKESMAGYFMHSDVAKVGNIKTSSELLNKIYAATNQSYLSNLFGYPTDCPQREKNGWTGDAHIASETGLYNYDGITVYEKWMADHRDEQQPNGVLPSIIPTGGWGYEWGNGPDWTSTIAIIPWNVYLFYGDTKVLADNYENIKRYVDHINSLYPTGLTDWGLGDWAPVKSKSPVELTSSAYYYTDANILAKAAKLLGHKDDFVKYNALALKIKNAINGKYLNANTGIYASGHQTEQSVPLYWGIVPDSLKLKAAKHLADTVKANNYHLDAGVLGAKAILGALSDNGQAETAFRLASQDTYPSWGWWIKNGATTLYENWNIDLKRDLSLNHIMFGEVGAWMFKSLGGIKVDEAQPGFKNVLLQPNFTEGLNYFESEHDGPYGKIISSWKREGKTISYHIIIPANSTATVILPKHASVYLNHKKTNPATSYQLAAGSYDFQIN